MDLFEQDSICPASQNPTSVARAKRYIRCSLLCGLNDCFTCRGKSQCVADVVPSLEQPSINVIMTETSQSRSSEPGCEKSSETLTGATASLRH